MTYPLAVGMTEPTPEQCSSRAKVFEDDHRNGFAIWYPQMGGYSGRAVAVFDKQWIEFEQSAEGGCVDVYVWHNGDFPFHEGENPALMHHCDPQQFIDFGKRLKELNDAGKVIGKR